MSRAFVFPGQGSQFVGMGKELNQAFNEAREVFEEVDESLSQSLSKLMFEGPEDELLLTENAQPAIMAVSLAIIKVLEKQGDFKISDISSFVAGHSLGEYTALASSGSISLSDASVLLKTRGKAMQDAVPVGKGGMAALIGSDIENIEILLKQTRINGEVSAIANDNSTGQVVISGHKGSINRAIESSREFKIRKAVLLAVSAPFHCSLMEPAKQTMKNQFDIVNFKDLSLPLVANVNATAVKDFNCIKKLLIQQITGMVRWRESILYLSANGVEEIVEVGAGKVLSGLVKRINKSILTANIQTPDDVDRFLLNI